MEAKLKVILLKHTPNPEETIAMAAKLCYSPSDIESLKEKIESKDQKDFIEKLMSMGHMTPVEHPSYTFAIEGISRACSHQLVRHRLASYSQQSQRYVKEDKGFDYVIPEAIKNNPNLLSRFETVMKDLQSSYNILLAEGINGEDARFVLPNACETKIMLTMNSRELLYFFNHRCCNRAQWEIRAMATEMLRLAKPTAPTIFKLAGPSCMVGPCPEGSLSCGKAETTRYKFLTL